MSISRCAQILQNGDPDKFFATLIAPKKLRPILYTVFAFHYEISKIPYSTDEEILAEIKFKWWEQELTHISKRKFTKNRNEILDPLSDLIIKNDIPVDLFLEAINARRFDIGSQIHRSFYDQVNYIEDIFSSLLEIILRSCEKHLSPEAVLCVRKFGFVLGVANLLVALPALEILGKNPIFLNFNEKDTRLKSKNGQLLSEKRFAERVLKLVEAAESELIEARKYLRFVDKKVRPILLCCASGPIILKKARRDPRRVQRDAIKLSPLYKIINLFRARIRNKI
ncbi:MAG: squalene/phytoene synthase family protein [Pseudomonadota bacterium]|nr:squalene/phytoene synthase family protein [Pseudomonadota bacterium]